MSGVGLSWRSNGVSPATPPRKRTASGRGPSPTTTPVTPTGAVIGGLMVSTLFTLVLIPTLYVMFEERFPRTIAPIDDDAPPRREAHAQ
ncbi:MAG: hypothetical protein DME03_16135 [Candidatus Rokuibacteriota bacterium]|nr:MAG: hypothetical protein DME03_16135 [Candidatus Rokubacteria bacterium]